MQLPHALRAHMPEIVLGVCTSVVALVVHLCSALRFPNDDQFITFRYIDHLASGKGFVYNIGEHVLGTTTPLFTMLGAFFKVLFPMITTPELVAYLNIILLGAGAVLVYRIMRMMVPEYAAWLGTLVFALDLSKSVPEGMESPLFIVLLLSFLYALLCGRHEWSAVFLSLACLTRPDAGLVAVLAFLYWWRTDGFRESVRRALIAAAIALPWLIFAWWYFGSPVPQSLTAKLHGHDMYIIPAIQAFKVQLAALSRMYWGAIFDPENLVLQTLVNLLPFLALALVGAWQLIRRGWWIIPAIPIAYFISFSISNPILFPWYATQMQPLWIILSWIGGSWAINRCQSKIFRITVCAVLLAGPLFFWVSIATNTDVGSKGSLWRVGSYLRDNLKQGENIALSNIGIVGYVTDAPILDTIGLVTPASSMFYPWHDECRDMHNLYQMPPELIRVRQPDWLVAGSAELTPCFVASDWFASHYVETWRDGPQGAVIWKKI